MIPELTQLLTGCQLPLTDIIMGRGAPQTPEKQMLLYFYEFRFFERLVQVRIDSIFSC